MDLKSKFIKTVKNPVYFKAGLILTLSASLFFVIYIWDNSRKMDTDETGRKILRRAENGQNGNIEELEVQIGEIR